MITKEQFFNLEKYGLKYFREIKEILSDDDYWTILRALWIDKGECTNEWKDLLFCKRKRRHKIMKSSDRQFLNKLPKIVTAYRVSFNSNSENKWNWTLSKEFAERYAKNKPNSFIEERQIEKKQIFAYFNSRKEDEILVKELKCENQ